MSASNHENDLDKLLRAIEKVGKIVRNNIEQDDINTPLEDLKWFEEHFYKLSKLREENSSKFYYFIDPEDSFGKEDFRNFDKINSSTVESIGIDIKLPVIDKNVPNKLYELNFFKNYNRNLIKKYIQTIYLISQAGRKKEFYDISQRCQLILGNYLHVLLQIEDKNKDFKKVVIFYLNNLRWINEEALKIEKKQIPNFLHYSTYRIYLDNIFSKECGHRDLMTLFYFCFANISDSIKLNKNQIFESFIEATIEGSYAPFLSSYPLDQISELIRIHRSQEGEYVDELKQINLLRRKAYNLNNLEEFFEWQTRLLEIVKSMSNVIAVNHGLIEEAITDTFKLLKYNLLKETVIKLLVFCLFKKKYDLVKYSLIYNQPPDSSAYWTNKEIVPVYIEDILGLLSKRYNLESQLKDFWKGHHDIEPYFDQLIILLLHNSISRKERGLDQEEGTNITFFDKKVPSELETYRQMISKLKNEIAYQVESKSSFINYFIDESGIHKINTVIETLLNQIEKSFGKTIEESKIKTDDIATNIISVYDKKSKLSDLLVKGNRVETLEKYDPIVAINYLVDKTTFIETWHIPVVNFYSSYGNYLVDQENGIILSQYAKKADSPSRIFEYEIPKILDSIDLSNKIIIGQNVFFDSILRYSKDYVPKWKEEMEVSESQLYAGTYKGAKLYTVYDRTFDRLFILENDSLGVIEEGIIPNTEDFKKYESFIFKVLAFSDNPDATKFIIEEPPQWLKDEVNDPRKYLDYLKKKVSIKIYKGLKVNLPEDFYCKFFIIKK